MAGEAAGPSVGKLPILGARHWPSSAYRRTDLPERVLQFGTGVLLRAVAAAAVDAANRALRFNGRIVVVQSTPHGSARAMNAQAGLFTLVERGIQNGEPVERTRLVGSISRALVADDQWEEVRRVVARPELQVIVSNVTEAGFRLDDAFPARLTDLLYTRFTLLPAGPSLFVIPTELVPDNGPRLAEMVDQLAANHPKTAAFRGWLPHRVRFCSSLVDRITTSAAAAAAELEARLGYSDALLTVTEPHCLWAIEGDPGLLGAAFQVDAPPRTVFAPDIRFFSEQKNRLLNGAHTALAPLALLAGVATVREAMEHARLRAFLHRILFDEIVPSVNLPGHATRSFAQAVLDRFRNPWLEHRWQVIATNQTTKLRVRVLPSVAGFAAARGRVPEGLGLACAAYLRYMRPVAQLSPTEGTGWWRGESYPIHDVDFHLLAEHWWAVDPDHAPAPVPAETLERLAGRVFGDARLWGPSIERVPGWLEMTARWLRLLEDEGMDAALDALHAMPA